MAVKKELVNKKNFEKLLLKSANEALQMVRNDVKTAAQCSRDERKPQKKRASKSQRKKI